MRIVFFVVALVVLVTLAVAAHSLAYFPGDLPIAHAVQALSSDRLDVATGALTWTGFPPQSWLVFGAVVVGLGLFGYRLAAIAAALAAVASGQLYFLVEQFVGRPRPSGELVHVAYALPMTGFPSGHVATFTAVFGFAAYVAYRALKPSAVRWVPVALVAILLALMGFARMYMGQHWPSDVLAGGLLGGLTLSVVIRLYSWCLTHSPVRRFPGRRERSLVISQQQRVASPPRSSDDPSGLARFQQDVHKSVLARN